VGFSPITAALTCVDQSPPPPPIPHNFAGRHEQAGELGPRGRFETQLSQTKTNSKRKSLGTYKAVEHGAGHPSCEAHVEERQGCAWMTHSRQSSSTTRARGAGITILLPAGGRPPLVRSEPLFLPPFFSLLPTPRPPPSAPFAHSPLLRSCSEPTRRLSFRNPPDSPHRSQGGERESTLVT